MASSSPSETTGLQNLCIVLSELTSPLLITLLLDTFTNLNQILSRAKFCHLETISITLAISPDLNKWPTTLRTRDELERIQKETCAAFAGTVVAHGVRIGCDAVNLIVVHEGSDFWDIRRKEDGITAERVCVW